MALQVSEEITRNNSILYTVRIGTVYHSHANPIRVMFRDGSRTFDVLLVPRGRAAGHAMRLEVQGVEVFTNYRPQNHYQRIQYYRSCARFLTKALPQQITCKCCSGKTVLPIDSSNILISEYRYPEG